MNDVKVKTTPLILNGRRFDIVFDLNVMYAINDRYGTIDISQHALNLKETEWILLTLINNSIDIYNENHSEKADYIDEKWLRRCITSTNISEIANIIISAFSGSLPECESDGEEDLPNRMTE